MAIVVILNTESKKYNGVIGMDKHVQVNKTIRSPMAKLLTTQHEE